MFQFDELLRFKSLSGLIFEFFLLKMLFQLFAAFVFFSYSLNIQLKTLKIELIKWQTRGKLFSVM